MNWDHVNACLKEAFLYHGIVDGTRVVSNGYVMFAVPESFEIPERSKEHSAVSKLWEQALAAEIRPETVGGCAGADQKISRYIGKESVIERRVRCFGAGVTWTSLPHNSGAIVLAHRGGTLEGIVMTLKYPSEPMSIPEPTDVEVFSPFASEQNAWYLVDGKTIDEKIADLEVELEEAEEKLSEAEAVIQNCGSEIASLRKLRKQRTAA